MADGGRGERDEVAVDIEDREGLILIYLYFFGQITYNNRLGDLESLDARGG